MVEFNDRRFSQGDRVRIVKGSRAGYVAGYEGNKVRVDWGTQGGVLAHPEERLEPAPVTRRSTQEREDARSHLIEHFQKAPDFARPPEGTSQSDLDALVKKGQLERRVNREWDPQKQTSRLRIQAGSSIRHRAYYRITKEDDGTS